MAILKSFPETVQFDDQRLHVKSNFQVRIFHAVDSLRPRYFTHPRNYISTNKQKTQNPRKLAPKKKMIPQYFLTFNKIREEQVCMYM